jgi:hypothetical protein
MSGRGRLLAGLAVVVSGGLVGAGAYALDQSSEPGIPAAALASPTPEPTTETPTETPEPTPTLSPTPRPTPTATRSATPQPTIGRYPFPSPTAKYAGLALTAVIDGDSNDASGHTFVLQGDATDGDGTIFVNSVNWGDGTADGGESSPASCPAYASPTSPPGPYRPDPDHRKFARKHTYTKSGPYTVVVSVRSINVDCRPNGPKPETATVRFTGPDAVIVP